MKPSLKSSFMLSLFTFGETAKGGWKRKEKRGEKKGKEREGVWRRKGRLEEARERLGRPGEGKAAQGRPAYLN